MIKESADLLPCPFCGGDDILLDFKHPVYASNGREFSARCQDCGCEGPHKKDPREGWNMRPNIKDGANLQTHNSESAPCFLCGVVGGKHNPNCHLRKVSENRDEF